jgi:antitoxin component YwqK of YwqJK toxin-antitoxin module
MKLKVIYQVNYANGQPHIRVYENGRFEKRYRSGALRKVSDSYYVHGQYDHVGKVTEYYEDGKTKATWTQVKAKRIWTIGKINYERIEIHKSGQYVGYHHNGKFSIIANYSEDRLEGVVITFYKRGYKESEGVYKYGLKCGLHKRWYPTGQLQSEIEYQTDKKSGLCIKYYVTGQVWKRQFYLDGKKFGR